MVWAPGFRWAGCCSTMLTLFSSVSLSTARTRLQSFGSLLFLSVQLNSSRTVTVPSVFKTHTDMFVCEEGMQRVHPCGTPRQYLLATASG